VNEIIERALRAARIMRNQRTGECKAIDRYLELAEQGKEVDTGGLCPAPRPPFAQKFDLISSIGKGYRR
jgi:hypothetical protein